MDKETSNIAVVIIGRNEGERLIACIKSVLDNCRYIVYVDSASTDGSVNAARKLGVTVVELDMNLPFTAARARNAGFQYLCEIDADINYIQFVDGDCQIDNKWLQLANDTLDKELKTAVVCGRRRERFPEHSVYNYLCDLEWNTPIGIASACGGDFMVRSEVFKAVDGFNNGLIAGEEPELCIRIRRQGWGILRIDAEMTLHDANITRIGQWWKRSKRAGYAFAEGAFRYGNSPEKHWVNERNRAWCWAFIIPLLVIASSLYSPVFLGLFIIYPIQIARLANRRGIFRKTSWQYAWFSLLGKFPELQGQLCFFVDRFKQSKSTIIEYK